MAGVSKAVGVVNAKRLRIHQDNLKYALTSRSGQGIFSSELRQSYEAQLENEFYKKHSSEECAVIDEDGQLERVSELHEEDCESLEVREKRLDHRANWRVLLDKNIVSTNWFGGAILTMIVINCVFLALNDPFLDQETTLAKVLNVGEYVFAVVFGLEMVLKMICFGFFGAARPWTKDPTYMGGYFRNGWNILDFIIVVAGFLSFSPTFGNITAIRTVRVLRPLRSLNKLPALAMLVTTLVKSLSALVSVGVVMMFFFVIFGITGLRLFQGRFHNRCYHVDDLAFSVPGDLCGGVNLCDADQVCMNEAANPNMGATGFDNMGMSMVTLFTCMTFDDWDSKMYAAQATAGVLSWIYFVSWILCTSYLALNLVVAVVSSIFTSEIERKKDNEAAIKKMKKMSKEVDTSLALDGQSLDFMFWLDEDKKKKRLANIELERQRSTQSGGAVSFNAFWDEIERLEKVRIVKFMQSLLFDTFTRETSPKNSAASLADGSEPKSESKEPEDEQKETTGPASEAEVRDGKQGNSDGENGTGLSSKAVRIHVSIPDVSTGKDNSATISLTPPLRAATETTDAVLPDIETPGRASPNPGNGSNQSGMFSYKPRILAQMRSPSSFAPNPSKVPWSGKFEKYAFMSPNKIKQGKGANKATGILSSISRITADKEIQEAESDDDEEDFTVLNSRDKSELFVSNVENDELDLQRSLAVEKKVHLELARLNRYLSSKPAFFTYTNKLIEHKFFSGIIILCILINTICLGMDHHRISKEKEDLLESINTVMTWTFVGEMVLKFVGLGLRGYAMDPWNLFDGVVVCFSFVELAIGGGGALTVLRTFRLLRIFKLVRASKDLRKLMVTVGSSASSVGAMMILLGIVIFIFAVMGLQMFAGGWQSRWNFNSFPTAVLTTFQVMTGDNWTSVLYDSINSSSFITCIFFIPLVIFGKDILMSLFISILLQGFAAQDNATIGDDALVELGTRLKQHPAELEALEEQHKARGKTLKLPGAESNERIRLVQILFYSIQLSRIEKKMEVKAAKGRVQKMSEADGGSEKLTKRTFFCLTRKNPLRRVAVKVAFNNLFDSFIVLCIVVSCAFLALEKPGISPRSQLFSVLSISEDVFVVIFVVEMVLKVVALGFFGKHGYIRNPWNVLDFIVVLGSLGSLAFPSLAIIRSLRAMRPIRLTVRSASMKVVVKAILMSIPSVATIIMFCGIFWVIFGIMGVSLFKGQFFRCNDNSIATREECVGTYTVELQGPQYYLNAMPGLEVVERDRLWFNRYYNFDNVGNAFLTLFQAASLNAWTDIMYDAMDVTGVDKQPELNANANAAFFFVSFIFVCSFFTLNLFVGSILDSTMRMKDEYSGSAFLLESQVQWAAIRKLINKVKLVGVPIPPTSKFRVPFYKVALASWFDWTIVFIILLNTALLATTTWPLIDQLETTVELINTVFVIIFTIEAAIKIIGLGFSFYISDSWNRFDLLLVVVSLAAFAVEAGGAVSVLRLLRIGRIFKLMKRTPMLASVFETLITSLPALWNVGLLLFVFFFGYAVLGVYIFGEVRKTDGTFPGFDNDINFDNFSKALQTLFRLATIDAWGPIHMGAALQPPHCSEELGDCGSKIAPLYILSFVTIVSWVMLNLYISVIMNAFNDSNLSDAERITWNGLLNWSSIWSKFDKFKGRRVSAKQFLLLMCRAPKPFGFGIALRENDFYQRGTVNRIARKFRFQLFLERNPYWVKPSSNSSRKLSRKTKANEHSTSQGTFSTRNLFSKTGRGSILEGELDRALEGVKRSWVHETEAVNEFVWVVHYKNILKTLASRVAGFNIGTDYMDAGEVLQERVDFHYWYSAQTIQLWWRRVKEKKNHPVVLATDSVLKLHVSEGWDLTDLASIGKQDPYCLVTVGPEQLKTKVHLHGGTKPKWDQMLLFAVPKEGLVVKVEVFDKENVGKDKLIGKASIPFETLLLSHNRPMKVNLHGQGITFNDSNGFVSILPTFLGIEDQLAASPTSSGQRNYETPVNSSFLGDTYSPGEAGKLIVTAHSAMELTCHKNDDPYVILSVGKRASRRTTVAKGGGRSPTWGQELELAVLDGDEEVKVEVCDIGQTFVGLKELLAQPGVPLYWPLFGNAKTTGQIRLSAIFRSGSAAGLQLKGLRPSGKQMMQEEKPNVV